MPTLACTSPENLMKIGPVHSEIIALNGDREEKQVTPAERKPFGVRYRAG